MYEERIYQESSNTLELFSTILDNELQKVENLSFQISTDDTIQRYLDSRTSDLIDYEDYMRRTSFLLRLRSYAFSEQYLSSIQIYDKQGGNYLSGFGSNVERERMASLLKGSNGENIWFHSESENKIMAARIIRKKENVLLDHLGILVITIDMDQLMNQWVALSPNRFIVTKDQQVIYRNNNLDIGVRLFTKEKLRKGYAIETVNNHDFMVSYKPSRYSNLTYYNFLPYDYITDQTAWINKVMMFSFLFMLLITMILSKKAASLITRPLEGLTRKMKKVQKGDFTGTHIAMDQHGQDEVSQLHVNFQVMMDRINKLIKENYEKQLIIKETEYKALQAQVNPHFLYNTLDSINWFARIHKQEKISMLTESLAHLLRNILSKKEPLITVDDELDIVKDYMTIQQHRFRDRLHFSLDYEIGVGKYLIPKLTIQPMVENAIQHALEQMLEPCYISVTLKKQNNLLIIMIEDNGPGIDIETISDIFKGKVKSKGSGIGIYNIHERINLMFGTAYGVQVDNTMDKGTRIKITLPFMDK